MKTLLSFLGLLCAASLQAQSGGTVILDWAPVNLGSNTIVNYRIHWSQTPLTYTYSQAVGTNTSLQISNLVFGPWYFSGVTLANGQVSDPSSEVLWTNKPPAPALRIRAATSGGTVSVTLPMDGSNVAAQSAANLSGPWSNWFTGQIEGPPAVTHIQLNLDAADPSRFIRLTP